VGTVVVAAAGLVVGGRAGFEVVTPALAPAALVDGGRVDAVLAGAEVGGVSPAAVVVAEREPAPDSTPDRRPHDAARASTGTRSRSRSTGRRMSPTVLGRTA
jgi:hypothetical protein